MQIFGILTVFFHVLEFTHDTIKNRWYNVIAGGYTMLPITNCVHHNPKGARDNECYVDDHALAGYKYSIYQHFAG